jgi:hypothetical protein
LFCHADFSGRGDWLRFVALFYFIFRYFMFAFHINRNDNATVRRRRLQCAAARSNGQSDVARTCYDVMTRLFVVIIVANDQIIIIAHIVCFFWCVVL